jgi:hypothetical protein
MYILFLLSHDIWFGWFGPKLTSLSQYYELEYFQWLILNPRMAMHFLIQYYELYVMYGGSWELTSL